MFIYLVANFQTAVQYPNQQRAGKNIVRNVLTYIWMSYWRGVNCKYIEMWWDKSFIHNSIKISNSSNCKIYYTSFIYCRAKVIKITSITQWKEQMKNWLLDTIITIQVIKNIFKETKKNRYFTTRYWRCCFYSPFVQSRILAIQFSFLFYDVNLDTQF